ncbi:hypothetical protein FQN49_005426, partial [Arthroderma sp. PD_2]
MDPLGFSSSHLRPPTSAPNSTQTPAPAPSIRLSPPGFDQNTASSSSAAAAEGAGNGSQQYQQYSSGPASWAGGPEQGSAGKLDGSSYQYQADGQGTAAPIAATTTAGSKKSQPSTTTKIRRRNRMITSCLECRRRKLKCDRLHPCTNCSKFKRHCLFLSPTTDALSRMKLMELKEKMGSLELVLEQDVAARQTGQTNPD